MLLFNQMPQLSNTHPLPLIEVMRSTPAFSGSDLNRESVRFSGLLLEIREAWLSLLT